VAMFVVMVVTMVAVLVAVLRVIGRHDSYPSVVIRRAHCQHLPSRPGRKIYHMMAVPKRA
jgi:hypothetical protein